MKKHLIAFLLFMTMIVGASCQKTSTRNSLFNMPALLGTNVAGGDVVWGQANTDNPIVNQDYLFVSNQDIDYLSSKKVNFIRLIVSWETLQPNLNQPLSTNTYNATLQARVAYATSKGMYVLIEPHGGADTNFARYKGNLVGTTAVPNSAFADFWTRMAFLFKNNPNVMYGLSNEPHDMSTMQWFAAAQAAITGIRSTGSIQPIFIPGNGWTGASSWTNPNVDTATTKVANSTAFLTLIDPATNLVASIHMYLDTNGGGGGDDIASATIGVERMTAVVNWAKANNVKIHLSEIGANLQSSNAAAPTAKVALQNLFSYINANSSTVIGWSWWAYGPPSWWGGYHFALSPANASSYGIDSAQMVFLAPYFATTAAPPPTSTVVADASPPPPTSPSFPTNPISFTKNTVFTTNSGQTNWVYVPNGYDSTHNTPTQLFVWLHGCGGQSQYDVSMVSYFTNQGWISLAPGGRETTCWSGLSTDGPKILAAIADLKTHFNIDPRRVVLGGYSSGGDIGYPLIFANANMFAGALFENTGPSSAALTASQTAAWKLPIVHLAHLSDTTYPIAAVRTNMQTLRNNGFAVTLIEKAGTHWDNDSGTTGTQYDLRTFLLPHLNDGWVSPGGVVTPPVACVYTYSAWGVCQSNSAQTRTIISSTPTPCTAGPQILSQACTYIPPAIPPCIYTYSPWGECQSSNIQSRTVISTTPTPCTAGPQLLSQTCTYVPPVGDTDGDGILDINDKCPTTKGIVTSDGTSNGCPGLVVSAVKTYDWGSGYCKQFYFTNNNPVSMSWKSMTIHLNDGKLRGAGSVWGGTFPNPNATGTIVVTPSQNTKVNPGQKSQTVGFCADYGSTKYVGTNGGLTY